MSESDPKKSGGPRRADQGGGGKQRGSYLGLLAAIAGIALVYWLATVFVDWNKTQECVGYGKRNCGPNIELHDD
ncbi:MAG TPA: hypothetical protein VEJ16_18350 [Alphaproteobacteria bacterium]|nr:hypothetical protein [Alphaproteobacteria bacterium]